MRDYFPDIADRRVDQSAAQSDVGVRAAEHRRARQGKAASNRIYIVSFRSLSL
jgi:hypothetical protein